jgi:chemotaxis regulatin CheY-phosphate phosphatase CheZ
LSYAIEETNKASCRVFELIERQKRLLCENDSLVAQIIAERTQDVGASALLGRYRSNHQEIAAIGHEITLAHEFQDLCGQNINKVMKLLSTLDSDIREMFRRLGCVIAPYDPNLETGDSVSQSETDDILRDLGL